MDASRATVACPAPDGPVRATVRICCTGRADASLHEALSANLPTSPTEVTGK